MKVKNKVLVKVIVPEIDSSYDIFIPVNEIIWKVKRLILKSIKDLTGGFIDDNVEFMLVNKETGQVYLNNITILNSDIRNATELILITSNESKFNFTGVNPNL